jgi:GAF domain-containing protein
MLWILSAVATAIIAVTVYQDWGDPSQMASNIPYFVAWLGMLVLALPPKFTRFGFTLRVGGLIGLGYTVGTYLLWNGGPQGMGDLYLIIAPLVFSVLGRQWAGIYSAMASILIYVVVVSLHFLGYGSVTPPDLTRLTTLLDSGGNFALLVLAAVWVQRMFNSYLTGALQETTRSQTLLKERADELATSNTLLQRRTRQLQTAAQISQTAAAVLDPDDLVQRVAGLIQHQLVLYHVSLFLTDQDGQRAILKASTGELGRQMLAQGYWIEVGGTSPVGWCIANGQASISLDVSGEAARLDDLLLPKTRSNVSLPLQSRGRVIGAMNVQSTEREAFSHEDIAVLQTIADQLAVAIDNAQQFAETRARVESLEAIQRTYVREEWARFTRTQEAPLYERARPDLPPFGDTARPEALGELQQAIEQATARQEVVAKPNGDNGAQQAALVAPLRLRGEVIGALGLHEADRERQWTEDEVALVEAVATQMALAIENARLLEETQQRAGRLALVNRVSGTAGAASNLEALMDGVRNEIIPAFEADVFFIAFYDEEAGEMDYQYVMDEGVRIPSVRRPMGQGAAFNVVTGRKPILIHTAEEYRRLQPTAPTLGETRASEAWLGVPMMVGDRVIGVINVQSYRPHMWDEEDVLLLSTIADQVAVSIENVRLLEETQQRAERLDVVNRITAAASAAISTDDLLETVYNEITPILHPKAAFIALYDEETDELDFRVTLDEKGRGGRERHPLKGFSSVVVNSKRLLSIRDYEQEKERLPKPIMVGEGAKLFPSWLGVPMLVGDRVIGIISVMSDVANAYSDEDEQLLTTIADQVAVAIENVRLFEETQQRAERLSVVNRVAGTAGAALSTAELVEAVYGEIDPVFRPDAFFIALYDEEARELDWRFYVDEGTRQTQDETRRPLGYGLTSAVITEKRTVVVRDRENEPEYGELMVTSGTGKLSASWIGVPMMVGDRVIGVINVQSYQPNIWGDEDELLLQTTADQVAVALENVRLFEEARIHAEELAVLNELAQALTARLGVDEVLEEAYRGASRLVDTDNFHIGLYDQKKHVIAFPTSEDDTGEFLLPAEKGVSGYILRTRQPVLIEDEYAEWTAERGIDSVGHDALSWVGAPLLVGNQPMGVMFTQSFERTQAFDEHDRDLLASIANQVAIALQNARLFEDASTRAEELTVLNELAQSLTAATSLDEVLEEAYQGASRLLHTTSFYVGLYDPNKFEISFPFDSSESEEDRQIVSIPADQGLTGYIVQNRESVLIGEDMDEQLEKLGIESIGGDSLSWLGVPMMIGDQVMGVMVVQSYATAKAFDERDRGLLAAIASQTAIAIQSARLFEQTQMRAEQERQIYEITTKLRRSPDISTILQTAVEELGRVLRTDRALVRLTVKALEQPEDADAHPMII